MATYTADRTRESVIHVESNTWTCGEQVVRFHEYRCRACSKPFVWSYKPYNQCPWCGYPIVFFDRRKAATR